MNKIYKLPDYRKLFHCFPGIFNYIISTLLTVAIFNIPENNSSHFRPRFTFLMFLFSQHYVYSHRPKQALYIQHTRIVIKSQNQKRGGGVIIVYITPCIIYGYGPSTYDHRYTIPNYIMSSKLRRWFVFKNQNLAKYIIFMNCYDCE